MENNFGAEMEPVLTGAGYGLAALRAGRGYPREYRRPAGAAEQTRQ